MILAIFLFEFCVAVNSVALSCPPFLSPLRSLSFSNPIFELPKDGPPLVDRLTNYKSTKRLNHHLKAPFCFPPPLQNY